MRDEIIKDCAVKIIKVLADILHLQENQISQDDGLFEELGFESVEILELEFAVEQEFNINIDKDVLWHVPNYLLEGNIFCDGKFSEEAIDIIKKSISDISDSDIIALKSPHDLIKFILVKDLIAYICIKIG